MTDMYKQTGMVKTDLYCHNCDANFIARVDFDIDGQHIIECPHCGHEHCRNIEGGVVTGDRWDGHNDNTIRVDKMNVWKHNSIKAETHSISHFLQELWINRYAGE